MSPAVEAQSLTHWTTREVHHLLLRCTSLRTVVLLQKKKKKKNEFLSFTSRENKVDKENSEET